MKTSERIIELLVHLRFVLSVMLFFIMMIFVSGCATPVYECRNKFEFCKYALTEDCMVTTCRPVKDKHEKSN